MRQVQEALMSQVQGVENRAKELLVKRIRTQESIGGYESIMRVHSLGGVYDETVRKMIDEGRLSELSARVALGDPTVDRIMVYDYELGAEI